MHHRCSRRGRTVHIADAPCTLRSEATFAALKALRTRLEEAGKSFKVAIIAVARILLTQLNAIIRDGRNYEPGRGRKQQLPRGAACLNNGLPPNLKPEKTLYSEPTPFGSPPSAGQTILGIIINVPKLGVALMVWNEEWTIWNNFRDIQFEYIKTIMPKHARVLDIGGASFVKHFAEIDATYHMIDLEKPMLGEGGHNVHPDGFTYDGETLPFAAKSYDVVIIGFVLHHAAQFTIGLLQQTYNITKNHVLVLEDLGSPAYPRQWLDRNHRHQPGGVYRDDKEWRALFDLVGFKMTNSVHLRRADDPDERPYRALYHLTKG